MKQRKDWLQHIRWSVIVLTVLCAMILGQSGPVVPGLVDAQEPTPAPETDELSPIDVDRIEIIAVEPVAKERYLWYVPSPDGKKALISTTYGAHWLDDEESLPVRMFDLWLLDQATEEKQRIADIAIGWEWSPDSSSFTYISPTTEHGIAGDLNVVDLTGESRRIARADIVQGFRSAQWLATNEIIYIHDGYVWGVQPDGSDAHRLNDHLHLSHLRPKGHEGLAVYDGDVSRFEISPDGRRVAYLRRGIRTDMDDPRRAATANLWISDIDGSNNRQVVEYTDILAPAWSPDSKFLAHRPQCPPPEPWMCSSLAILDIETGSDHLVYEAGFGSFPNRLAWSPDSSTLAFRVLPALPEADFRLWFTNTDGSKQKVFEDIEVMQTSGFKKMTWEEDERSLMADTKYGRYRIELDISR